MRRLALALLLALAAAFPATAPADPQPPPNCTFSPGVTTCVETSVVLVATREEVRGPDVCVVGTVRVTTRTTRRHGLRGRVFDDASSSTTFERDFGCIP